MFFLLKDAPIFSLTKRLYWIFCKNCFSMGFAKNMRFQRIQRPDHRNRLLHLLLSRAQDTLGFSLRLAWDQTFPGRLKSTSQPGFFAAKTCFHSHDLVGSKCLPPGLPLLPLLISFLLLFLPEHDRTIGR